MGLVNASVSNDDEVAQEIPVIEGFWTSSSPEDKLKLEPEVIQEGTEKPLKSLAK